MKNYFLPLTILLSFSLEHSVDAQTPKRLHMPADAVPRVERPISADELKKRAKYEEKEKAEVAALSEKASAGDVESQYKLGVHYCFEQPNEAIKWFRLAATQGIVAAQYDLGMLYMIGRGWNDAPQNYKEAYYWYSIALKSNKNDNLVPRGNDHLMIALKNMAKHFSMDEKMEIDKRVSEWQPTLPSDKTDPISPRWDKNGLRTSHDWDCAVM